MGHCRIWYTMLAASILLAILAGCAGPGNTQKESSSEEDTMTQTEVSVVLTDRQKEILEAGGLPTDYEELSLSQKGAIVAIEELLTYLEEKYNIEFTYLGYVPQALMDKEHLTACPAGGLPSDVVTVYRWYDGDGQAVIEDDYKCLIARPWYQAALESFFGDTFQPGTFQVYTKVTDADDGISEETVLKDASAEIYVLIDEKTCEQEQLESFAKVFGDWMKEQSESKRSSSASIYLVSEELIEKTNRFNYLNIILAGEKSGKVTCSISSAGEINIF